MGLDRASPRQARGFVADCMPPLGRLTVPPVSDAPAKKKDIKVHVLRCRAESCRALLPFEETDEGLLLGNMIDVATREGGVAFFPCPRCGGRNLVEEVDFEGRKRSRVTGFAAA
jgi:hypothetical protein